MSSYDEGKGGRGGRGELEERYMNRMFVRLAMFRSLNHQALRVPGISECYIYLF